jgi:hypothetical protein
MITMEPMPDNGQGFIDVSKLMAEGWQMQDHPQMLKNYWEYILKGYGEQGKDYHKLSEATYETVSEGKEEIYMRGQLLLGPNARNNLKEYHERNPITYGDE